jgi:hypothetical protein
VDDGLAVLGCYFDGSVLLRGRGPADDEREFDIEPLHFLRHVNHLVEGRRDETRETDNI